jgi:hypothetical protein
MPTLSTFGALIALAFRLCLKRWWFYALMTGAAIAVQSSFLAIHGLYAPLLVANTVVLPILVLVIYVFSATDATGEDVPRAARWERILERSWAVILIDIVTSAIIDWTLLAIGSNDLGIMLLGFFGYALMVLTIYADVNAALEPEVKTLWLIPRAFQRSAVLATSRSSMPLTLALVATNIGLTLIISLVAQLMSTHHVANVDFWISIPLDTVLTVPFAVLAVVVYLECIAREKAAATGR